MHPKCRLPECGLQAGLGLFEYMLLAEALGAEPVLVVNNGISHQEAVPPDRLGPYLQARLPHTRPHASHAHAYHPPSVIVLTLNRLWTRSFIVKPIGVLRLLRKV